MGEGSPAKIDYRKKVGTLIPTSQMWRTQCCFSPNLFTSPDGTKRPVLNLSCSKRIDLLTFWFSNFWSSFSHGPNRLINLLVPGPTEKRLRTSHNPRRNPGSAARGTSGLCRTRLGSACTAAFSRRAFGPGRASWGNLGPSNHLDSQVAAFSVTVAGFWGKVHGKKRSQLAIQAVPFHV